MISLLAALAMGFQQPQTPSLTDLQRSIDFLGQQLRKGEQWHSVEGKHVLLYYVESPTFSKDVATSYADAFDGCYESDCDTLKFVPAPDKVPTYLFPTEKELALAIHSPSHVEGVSLGYWDAFPDEGKGLTATLKATAARELGLVLVHSQLGTYGCALFTVGAAGYMQACYEKQTWLADPKPTSKVPLASLIDANATTPDSFMEGSQFCAFLVQMDKGDPSRLKQVMTELNKMRLEDLRTPGRRPWPERAEYAFFSIYGVHLDALETKWRAGG